MNGTPSSCSSEAIVRWIEQGTQSAYLQAWKCLRQNCFPKFDGKLRKLGLRNAQGLEDIRNDALADLFQNVQFGKFRSESDICTYFVQIGMNKWFKAIRKEKGRRKSQDNQLLESRIDQLTALHHGQLEGEAASEIKAALANDTDLQEIYEIVRLTNGNSDSGIVLVDHLEATLALEVEEERADEIKELIERLFPEGHHCPDTLVDYYFKYDGSYEKMATGIKRRVESADTVYERVKKQVNRCMAQIKKSLNP